MHKEALKLVFSNPTYLAIAGIIFAPIFVLLLHTRELLFFEPYFVFNLPEDSILSFALIIILSILMGVVISMIIFRLRNFKSEAKRMKEQMLTLNQEVMGQLSFYISERMKEYEPRR